MSRRSASPAAAEVVIAVEASPINRYDLLMIAGGYGFRPRLPSIMGTEGVGRVVAVGAGVKHLKEGDRTLVPFLQPAWAQRLKTRRALVAALAAGRRAAVRHAGGQSADRLSLADRRRETAPRLVGHPKRREFGRRSGDRRRRKNRLD